MFLNDTLSHCVNVNQIEICSQESNFLTLFKNEEIYKDFENAKGGFLIFIKQRCPYCTEAISVMDKNSLSYQKINVLEQKEKFEFIKNALNVRTVPQIFDVRNFKDIKHVGGCDDFLKYNIN